MQFLYKTTLLLVCAVSCTFGQGVFKDIKYRVEGGAYLSNSGQTPFLIRSNQYGTVPLDNPIFSVKAGLYKEYDSTYNKQKLLNKFGIGYGINAVVNAGKTNQVLLPEGYFKVRYGAFEFYAGRRREVVGIVDSTLTSGSYIWSGNALPIPKIQISIPNFTSILGKGLLSIKGAYSHGWFDNGLVENFYLHQKYLYARIGRPNWKVKIMAGFNHQVQWGGKPVKPYTDLTTGMVISHFLSDFSTYLKVVSGVSLNVTDDGSQILNPGNEAMNRAGNHLGTIDIATEINFKKFNLLIYRQSIYDDGSLYYMNNITDGLFGVSVKRKAVKDGITGICFEYLDTRSQGGATGSENTIPQLRGQDNYFNNEVYADSWTYKGVVIGTPFFLQRNVIDSRLIKRNLEKFSPNYIINNRVQAFLIALEGKTKNVEFATKLVYSHNLGSFVVPFDAMQFSFLSRIKYNLPKFSLVSNISFDEGKVLQTTLGAYLGVQKTF
ncbi:capsule assembly Wzi family protein [Emticicia sp. 17c]|uniref:capsule assembly Wzi family protein n=1 Tax=Emticicia sp. 17c TaxID=3127704 RepID=UPI00301C6AC4